MDVPLNSDIAQNTEPIQRKDLEPPIFQFQLLFFQLGNFDSLIFVLLLKIFEEILIRRSFQAFLHYFFLSPSLLFGLKRFSPVDEKLLCFIRIWVINPFFDDAFR